MTQNKDATWIHFRLQLEQLGRKVERDGEVIARMPPGANFFDETVWRTIEPREGCPDCGGTGDLLSGPAFTDLDAIPVP